MKVRDVMTKHAVSCGLNSNLAEVAELMWKNECGFLPVVGDGGNVIGVITDRDISIALGTRNQRPSELLVKDVMPAKLFTCTADDNIRYALKTMSIGRIRRLPVVDAEGALAGVLSIEDIVLKAREQVLGKDVSSKDVEEAYKAIRGRANPIKGIA